MRVRFTVVNPSRRVDIEVHATPGATMSDLYRELRAAELVVAGRTVHCGQTAVAPDQALGAPPLLDGAVLWSDETSRPQAATTPGLRQLRIVGGPDAGAVVTLRPGRLVVGREPGVALAVADTSVSRRHLAVEVDDTTVRIRDLRSANRSRLNGSDLHDDARDLAPGDHVHIGASTLEYHVCADARAITRPDGAGGLGVLRPPRISAPPAEFSDPPLPTGERPQRLGWLPVVLVPIALALALWWGAGSASYLAISVLSPLLLGLGSLRSRPRPRRTSRAARRHDAARAATLVAALETERRNRHAEAPDPAAVLHIALGPGTAIWERRGTDDDALRLRIGTGSVLARTQQAGSADRHQLHGVPITVDLPTVGVFAVAGPRPARHSVLRWIIAQAGVLHSPSDVAVVVLAQRATDTGWAWARWFPHTQDDGATRVVVGEQRVADEIKRLAAVVTERRQHPGLWSGRRTLLVVDDADGFRSVPGFTTVMVEGRHVGVLVVCGVTSTAECPEECGATLALDPRKPTDARLRMTNGHETDGITPDGVSKQWIDEIARHLAPLRDVTGRSTSDQLPHSVRLNDVIDVTLDPAGIVTNWSERSPSTRVAIGVTEDGPMLIDLAADGPHTLLAGTTGAGKSELLRTLVTSLAVANRPDELAFVLVDYKGGSAFAECARLPHTVGMVTDLDAHLTARALASLHAEIRRRETLLADAGAPDFAAYTARHRDPDLPPLARLVLVIDEFATLSAELPHFVTGLVDIARRGRSLGIHLILATQRPAGVVSPEIRANTALRICLRVTDDAESRDVIDLPDAAAISASRPGRGVVRGSDGALQTFQAAHVSMPTPDSEARLTVRLLGDSPSGVPQRPRPEGGTTDLDTTVDTVRRAAAQAGIAAARCPWLPPLPPSLPLSALRAAHPREAVIGLVDRPASQSQVPYALRPDDGQHLLIAGGPRSGRSTALLTLAKTLAATYPVSKAHLHAIDPAGAVASEIEALPLCGTAVGSDTAQGVRLLDRLHDEVTRRRRGAGTEKARPWLLLLLDSWEGFVEAYSEVNHGAPVDVLTVLLREGPAVGLTIVVTGGRALLASRITGLIARRLVLPLADTADHALAGVPTSLATGTRPPGRAVLFGKPGEEPVDIQIAHTTDDGAPAEFPRPEVVPRDADLPLRIRALPTRITWQATDVDQRTHDGPLWIPIGVGGDDGDVVGVDLAELGGLLIAGPAGCGRSSTIRALATWTHLRGTLTAVIASRGAPVVRDLPDGIAVIDPNDEDAASALLEAGQRRVVYVDDADTIVDSPAERVLMDSLARQDSPLAVVAAARTDDLHGLFRGVTVGLRRRRNGILLCPSLPSDGDLLGVRTSRTANLHPGRGELVVAGQSVPVQIALADQAMCG